jgi:hypothetical protein
MATRKRTRRHATRKTSTVKKVKVAKSVRKALRHLLAHTR